LTEEGPLKFAHIDISLNMEDPIILKLREKGSLNLGCAIPLEYYEEFLVFLNNLTRKARDDHLYYDITNRHRMPKEDYL
jgi:hypothetical protein